MWTMAMLTLLEQVVLAGNKNSKLQERKFKKRETPLFKLKIFSDEQG
jgi:hypothetical protein